MVVARVELAAAHIVARLDRSILQAFGDFGPGTFELLGQFMFGARAQNGQRVKRTAIFRCFVVLLHIGAEGVHQSLDLFAGEVAFLEKVTFCLEVIPASLSEHMRLDLAIELHAFSTLVLLFDLLPSLGFEGRLWLLRLLGVRFLLLSCCSFCSSLGFRLHFG